MYVTLRLWGLQEPTLIFNTLRLKSLNVFSSCPGLSRCQLHTEWWPVGFISFSSCKWLGSLPLHSAALRTPYIHQWHLFYEALLYDTFALCMILFLNVNRSGTWCELIFGPCFALPHHLVAKFLAGRSMSHCITSRIAVCIEWIENAGWNLQHCLVRSHSSILVKYHHLIAFQIYFLQKISFVPNYFECYSIFGHGLAE